MRRFLVEHLPALFVFVLLAAGPAGTLLAAEGDAPAAPAPLALAAIEITPAAPGVDTLCQLRVKVENRGERPASSLGFAVRVGGVPLPVYDNQLFLQEIPAGETTEVRLYNFWTNETHRPPPADGKLAVEVTLREATWFDISTAEDGTEVWKPLEPVSGLPVTANRVVALTGSKPPADGTGAAEGSAPSGGAKAPADAGGDEDDPPADGEARPTVSR